MKPAASLLAIAATTLCLSACGGSPFSVETRDSGAASAPQTTYEQLIREKRRLERTQGK